MYSDHFFFLITDLLEYKDLLRICSKPPKTGTQFVRTQQMSKCLIIPDVFHLRYPNNKSSLYFKRFKLRLHFELETRHHLLLGSFYLKRGYPLLGTTHGALHLRPIPIPGNVTCPHQLRHPYLLLRNHTNTLLKRSRCSAYTIAAC